ncbi:flagellar biosynthetic protein FliO [Paracoccaceae bacterium]|nr:flagellar biosynthetic protein FliO [Paracoccaceae bacterium]
MQVQDINLTQVLIVLFFLGALIGLQQLLKRNKFNFQTHFNQKKRIRFVDEISLSSTERIRLIRVDNKEYLFCSTKGCQPSVLEHQPNSVSKVEQRLQLKKSSEEKSGNVTKNNTKTSNVLSDAISVARKMNPKLGFKK